MAGRLRTITINEHYFMIRRNVRDLILLLRDVRKFRDVREMLEKCSVCYFVRTEFLLNY